MILLPISRVRFLRQLQYNDFNTIASVIKSGTTSGLFLDHLYQKVSKPNPWIQEYFFLAHRDYSVTEPNSVIMANTNTNLMESTSPTIYDIISDTPPDKNALHDIHYRFKVPDIWAILSLSKKYHTNDISKDILVHTLNISRLRITTTVHRTDTVSVIVACTNTPVVADIYGLIRLSNALTRVEERLSRVIDECGGLIPDGYETIPIPDNETWEVTMWHFGYDSPIEYTGSRFCAAWKDGQNALARAYSKKMKSSTKLRCEVQQYPEKSWKDVLVMGEHGNYEYRS